VSERRPWRRAALWLVFLGPFFFASYGFANWLASTRAHTGVIAFAWERAIPFLPWTIVPYWSIDLLYAISLFVCTTRREVDRHGQRLLFIQLVSIAFFIAFPLRFSFERPQSDGLFGALFTALTSFDKPFNQAPSLHIALLVAIWVRLAAHLPRTRWLLLHTSLHVWMALIGVSILTTYQHHFIDLPTGAALGFLALWALPDEEESPLRRWSFTRDRKRRRLALLYAAGAAACTALACLGGTWLWMSWPAGALALVALIYAAIGERGFQKSASGRISAGARALLAPYLGAAWLNSRLWTRNHPHPSEVRDGVWIGRIPTSGEPFAAIVDLCAELSCAEHPAYRCVPVLDLTVPDAEALRDAAQAIESAPKPLLVCCALGYSRSAAAVVEWLLTTRRAASYDEAAAMVRKARPSTVLHST
jgi:hypothetical protein